MSFTHIVGLIFVLIASEAQVLEEAKTCEDILGQDVIQEIKSYENVKERILDYVLKGEFKHKTYNELEKFIDRYGARPSGTQVLEDAIDYMIELARGEQLNDIVTEEVEVPRWERGAEKLSMLQPRVKDMAILGLGFSISTPPEGITAEVIVFNSFHALENTSNADVTGKIVLFDPIYTVYSETSKFRTQGPAKAAAKGAVASLVRSVTSFSINSPHTGAILYKEGDIKIPAAAVSIEDADLIGRLHRRGEKVVLNLQLSSTYSTNVSRNTIIDIKGTQKPDKQVIVSAHIDSWDVGQGAMDDGDGVFMSWAAPVILNRLNLTPKRTIRTILWTAEELGFYGAYAYEKAHRHELDNINIIFEQDQYSFAPSGLSVRGNAKTRCIMEEVLKLFESINATTVIDLTSPGTDVAVFVAKDIPAALYYNDNERYIWFHHTEGDAMNVLDRDEMDLGAAFWATVAYVVADLSFDIPR